MTHWDAQLAPGGMVGSAEDGEGINSQPLEGRRSTGDVGGLRHNYNPDTWFTARWRWMHGCMCVAA